MGLVALEGGRGALQVIPLVGGFIAPAMDFNENLASFYAITMLLSAAQIVGFVIAIIGQARSRRASRSRAEGRTERGERSAPQSELYSAIPRTLADEREPVESTEE